jgi:hypothetical protein
MKIRFQLVVALIAVMTALVGSSNAGAAPTQLAKYDLTFASASTTFTFGVAKLANNGAGNLTVDTVDCCIPGDLWTVSIDAVQPANAANDVSATGNGSTSQYTGAATSHPFINGSVTVSHSGGTNVFPAQMCVRFQYTKSPGVEITPPAGAIADGPACI